MVLIDCPECFKRVSSFAESCPDCGFPVSRRDELMHLLRSSVAPIVVGRANVERCEVVSRFVAQIQEAVSTDDRPTYERSVKGSAQEQTRFFTSKIEQAVKQLGGDSLAEFPVQDVLESGECGYLDLAAKIDGVTFAIEIDRGNKARSVNKLATAFHRFEAFPIWVRWNGTITIPGEWLCILDATGRSASAIGLDSALRCGVEGAEILTLDPKLVTAGWRDRFKRMRQREAKK